MSVSWPGIHCSTALARMTSNGCSGRHCECRRRRKQCPEGAFAPRRSCREKSRVRRSAHPGSALARPRSNYRDRSRCRRRRRPRRSGSARRDRAQAGFAHPRISRTGRRTRSSRASSISAGRLHATPFGEAQGCSGLAFVAAGRVTFAELAVNSGLKADFSWRFWCSASSSFSAFIRSASFPRAAARRAIARFGEGPWKGIYSLISVIGFVLIVWGFARARYDAPQLWTPLARRTAYHDASDAGRR